MFASRSFYGRRGEPDWLKRQISSIPTPASQARIPIAPASGPKTPPRHHVGAPLLDRHDTRAFLVSANRQSC
jgi:hypothetical protein